MDSVVVQHDLTHYYDGLKEPRRELGDIVQEYVGQRMNKPGKDININYIYVPVPEHWNQKIVLATYKLFLVMIWMRGLVDNSITSRCPEGKKCGVMLKLIILHTSTNGFGSVDKLISFEEIPKQTCCWGFSLAWKCCKTQLKVLYNLLLFLSYVVTQLSAQYL